MPPPHVHCTTPHVSTHTLSLSFPRDNESTHSHLTQAVRIHEMLPVKNHVVLAHGKGSANVGANLLLLFSNECVNLGTYPPWTSVPSSAQEEQQALSPR